MGKKLGALINFPVPEVLKYIFFYFFLLLKWKTLWKGKGRNPFTISFVLRGLTARVSHFKRQ